VSAGVLARLDCESMVLGGWIERHGEFEKAELTDAGLRVD
jgi:hypothetical protein